MRDEPAEWVATFELPDRSVVRFRAVKPDDDVMIAEAIRTASRETMLHRFFTPIRELAAPELRRFLTVDPEKEACLVGVLEDTQGARLVCGIRYVRLIPGTSAEVALTVHDDFQGLGLGTFMLRLLMKMARRSGILQFQADVLATNAAMIHVLRKVAATLRQDFEAGVYHFEFDLPAGE